MYAFFQPKISVEQEEADIKAMIDEEYEQREQEHIDYYKQMEEDYYKQMDDKVMTLQEKKITWRINYENNRRKSQSL